MNRKWIFVWNVYKLTLNTSTGTTTTTATTQKHWFILLTAQTRSQFKNKEAILHTIGSETSCFIDVRTYTHTHTHTLTHTTTHSLSTALDRVRCRTACFACFAFINFLFFNLCFIICFFRAIPHKRNDIYIRNDRAWMKSSYTQTVGLEVFSTLEVFRNLMSTYTIKPFEWYIDREREANLTEPEPNTEQW